MGEGYITYLMYNGLFIILGIGADDIFVLVDAWKQSKLQPLHISGSLETVSELSTVRGFIHEDLWRRRKSPQKNT